MKHLETLLNIPAKNGYKGLSADEIGDNHLSVGIDTPMTPDAFLVSDEEKKQKIAMHFKEIMKTMGLDLDDDSLKGTPNRFAKMYIDEIFSGLNPKNKPKIALFDNKYQYNQMLVEKDITFYSNCEHHFVPIIGKAHIAYISSGKVIGLSKLNRIVQYFAKRPQVQERLTNQIAKELKEILNTENVAVIIDAKHLCVSSRGVEDNASSTLTCYYGGVFNTSEKIVELQNYLK
ncbi:GTP cyclohydrolase I FolE [Tenacibaculum soleae]|uniref:GTP cyclohydrolase 1 n=1 Tax=Tenacibaculum soleae TaxID=447689 RepID=A0A1B9Y2F0_9FLAO|nr:GTP cyclohydrolase I FolE [Tenacibaculum soleae]MDO6744442.1 GTP cyclohydrolase I FolE [Tenacibaculum soleae]OCK43946.1 GTP cyclohydrolase I FolE [Tenacibaculum soleae]